ncbi:MAG: hypothetical protein LBB16_02355 [Puniceicoccales bacterium]|jgi:hypothetical protein|nr:hypothetical protein [Puniceicoccales bacterium]
MVKEGARGGWKREVEGWNFFPYSPKKVLGVNPGAIAEVHGVKHCLRATLVAEATAQVYRRLFKEFENIGEENIRLASAAAAYHDSGRQGEEVDVFDDLSAMQAREDLAEMGVSDDQCSRCGNVISNKDAPVEGKDPVAILLHEADCLEIQRIGFKYDPKYLDALQTDAKGRLILTPRDGVSREQIEQEIQDLIAKTKNLIDETKREYRKKAEEIGLVKADLIV